MAGEQVGKIASDIDRSSSPEKIDLRDYMMELADHIWIIVLFTLFCGACAGLYAYFCIPPTYSATAKLYVVSSSGNSMVDLTDLNIGSSLVSDYRELMNSDPVIDEVIEKMDLSYSPDELRKMIDISNPGGTRVICITIESRDYREALDMANTFAEVAVSYLPETMSTNAPNIAQHAKYYRKVAPNERGYAILGVFWGLLAICGYYFFHFTMDDTFHTAEDVESCLGLQTLAVVPEDKK